MFWICYFKTRLRTSKQVNCLSVPLLVFKSILDDEQYLFLGECFLIKREQDLFNAQIPIITSSLIYRIKQNIWYDEFKVWSKVILKIKIHLKISLRRYKISIKMFSRRFITFWKCIRCRRLLALVEHFLIFF